VPKIPFGFRSLGVAANAMRRGRGASSVCCPFRSKTEWGRFGTLTLLDAWTLEQLKGGELRSTCLFEERPA